jgi:hypothetical protein
MFRLTVLDRKTHYVLRAITASIEPALLQKTYDRNFDQALALVLNRFLVIAGRTATPTH